MKYKCVISCGFIVSLEYGHIISSEALAILCWHFLYTEVQSTCTDDPSYDCAHIDTAFNICADIDHASKVCRNYCNLCNYNPVATCADDPGFDCAHISVAFDICADVAHASVVCRKFCNLCNNASPCHPNPCVHGACAPTGSSNYQCTCNAGYTGKNCSTVSPCLPNPCIHGTCSLYRSSSYRCTCNSGYSGTNCNTVSPCHSNPCVHGTCCSTGSTTYHCNCISGYSGTNCGTAASPCHPNPCVHGTCSTTGSSTYQCTCNSGYSGTTCGTVDPCVARQCVQGTCSSTSGIPVCTCDPGYRGAFCDTDYDECLSSPCVHGACMDKVNGYLCTCSTGFTGKNCDQATSSPCSSNPCVHGSCAFKSTSGYSCTCTTGYTGVNCSSEIRDCKDVIDNHLSSPTNDVIYMVLIDHVVENVRCDMTTDGGGWTVLMNREGSTINFTKDSTEYALGFGNARSDFWIGLEDMHSLTSDGRRYQLRIELTRGDGSKYYEVYDDFSIGPQPMFLLHIGNARGTAGDSLRRHDGYGFTTVDSDHDSNKNTNCAVYLQGAWWFHDCYDSCLTCPYETPGVIQCRSMSWNELKYCEALKAARMLVRSM